MSTMRNDRVSSVSAAMLTTAVMCIGASCSSSGGSAASAGSETGQLTTGHATTSATNQASTTARVTDTAAGESSGVSPTTGSGDSGTAGATTGDTGIPECPYTAVDGMPAMGLELVGQGFDRPVLALGHPTEPDRLFVVEQGGAVRILEPGESTAPTDAFLELTVSCGSNLTIGCERGLLGFAFHPGFPEDPRVYVAYSPPAVGMISPPTRVSEFTLVDGDPNHADPGSERIVIEASQPAGNHNGGMIAFGPDGYLYIGLGDGGNGDDSPQHTGRDTDVILAKILRIDPEPDKTADHPMSCESHCGGPGNFDYTIPADNPFVGDASFAPEIYAWGFRNPWRFSFDPDNGWLYVGDVGQDAYEEIDVVVPGGDYGWSAMEGNHCFAEAGCDTSAAPGQANASGQIAPLLDYGRGGGCASVTGGAVYRSCQVPAWDGVYLYGDYCSGDLSALHWDGRTVQDLGVVVPLGERILGTGWNVFGDVFFTTDTASAPGGPTGDGRVYRLAPAT